MSDVDDLVTWLRAQLDDDERVALGIDGLSDDAIGDVGLTAGDATVDYLRRFHIDRVLAEVDAKRRILDLAANITDQHDDEQVWYQQAIGDVVRRMALPYDDRPGYRGEWRP